MSKVKYVIKSKKYGHIDEYARYSDALEMMNFYITDDTVDHWKAVQKRLKKAGSKCSKNDAIRIAEAEVKAEYYIEKVENLSCVKVG